MSMPRVRTLEESRNLPKDAVSRIECKKGTFTALMFSALPKGINVSILWPETYGKEWRLWDGRPTKAQRKAEPWL